MKSPVLVTIGVLAGIIGVSPVAHAQQPIADSLESQTVTLSGNSLEDIESRTVNEDFNRFFAEEPAIEPANNNVGSAAPVERGNGFSWEFAPNLELEVNEPLGPNQSFAASDNERFNGIQQVEVLVELDELD